MVRVVGKEGALGAGVGGNCSSGMDGSEYRYIKKKMKIHSSCVISYPSAPGQSFFDTSHQKRP